MQIITLTPDTIDQYGLFCVSNLKHEGFKRKKKWLEARFSEGMRFKLLLDEAGERAAFIEYGPGEYTWRAVEAPDDLVIHCMMAYPKKNKGRGYASALLDHCLEDARDSGFGGVAVVASEAPWLAGRALFRKHGFQLIDESPPSFSLLLRRWREAPLPRFSGDFVARRQAYRGLHLLYTEQCPYVAAAVDELCTVAETYGLEPQVEKLCTAEAARTMALSPYGVFNVVYDGQLLTDRYVSKRRFETILRKAVELPA